jgi:hypothetical protein
MRNKIAMLAVAVLFVGCGHSRGAQYPPAPKIAPITVNMGSVAQTFVTSNDVPVMRFTLSNTSSRPFTLARLNCTLSCDNRDARIACDLLVNGHRVSSNPVAIEPNVPFDVYFGQTQVQPGTTITVEVRGNFQGLRAGDGLSLRESEIVTASDGTDNYTRYGGALEFAPASQSLMGN